MTKSLFKTARIALAMAVACGASTTPFLDAKTDQFPKPTATLPVKVEFAGSTVLLPLRVNGSSTLWFILDTGANSCVLDHRVAGDLRLQEVGTSQGTGAGRGPVPYRRYRKEDVTFTVADTRFACEHVISVDLANQPSIIGRRVDGILGSDFIAQFVVEVDYERALVQLHNAERFIYEGSGDIIDLTFDRRLPYVEAEITVVGQPPTRRKLLVDSGSQDAVDDDLLLKSTENLRKVTGGVGLGQTYEVFFGRLAGFRLGRFNFKDVPSVAPGVALVGSEVLRRFRAYYDYRRNRMILEPNRHLNDPFPSP
ncbi:MAG TPA: retropepsin-like aspartic protease [Candidatus Binatia bacterium]|nr:retropepsin-like aspartic protease [Candidatus Binatia bacterium]